MMVVSSIIIKENKCEVFVNHVCTEGDSIEVLDDEQYLNLCQKNGDEEDKDDGNIKAEHENPKEHLEEIMKTLCTLTSKVEKLEKNEKKAAASKKSGKSRTFLSFGKKKKKLPSVNKNKEEKKLKPIEEKKPLLFIPEQSSFMNPTVEEYQFPYAPSTDDPLSVISTSDKYRVQNNSSTDATDLTIKIDDLLSSTRSKSKVVLEKVDSVEDSVLQSWVSNVVCAAADELEKNKHSPSCQNNAKHIAQSMVLSELENNENALFTISQYEEISASTANLIVTALLSNINKEKATLLAISHAIWGVLASKDCHEAACKKEVINSLGSLFPDAGIINDGESLILPELSCSTYDGLSSIETNNTNSVKYNSWTDFFDGCLGKVDLLVDGSTIITGDTDTLEEISILDTASSIMGESILSVNYEVCSGYENREITEQEFRENALEVREDPSSEYKDDAKNRSPKKMLSFKKFLPFSKKMNVVDI